MTSTEPAELAMRVCGRAGMLATLVWCGCVLGPVGGRLTADRRSSLVYVERLAGGPGHQCGACVLDDGDPEGAYMAEMGREVEAMEDAVAAARQEEAAMLSRLHDLQYAVEQLEASE